MQKLLVPAALALIAGSLIADTISTLFARIAGVL